MTSERIVTPTITVTNNLGDIKEAELREITVTEWLEYDWHDVTTYSDKSQGRKVYLRGKRIIQPPQDGWQYRRCDKVSDSEYRWERLTPESELAGAK